MDDSPVAATTGRDLPVPDQSPSDDSEDSTPPTSQRELQGWYCAAFALTGFFLINNFLPLLAQSCALVVSGFPSVCGNIIRDPVRIAVVFPPVAGHGNVTSMYYLAGFPGLECDVSLLALQLRALVGSSAAAWTRRTRPTPSAKATTAEENRRVRRTVALQTACHCNPFGQGRESTRRATPPSRSLSRRQLRQVYIQHCEPHTHTQTHRTPRRSLRSCASVPSPTMAAFARCARAPFSARPS